MPIFLLDNDGSRSGCLYEPRVSTNKWVETLAPRRGFKTWRYNFVVTCEVLLVDGRSRRFRLSRPCDSATIRHVDPTLLTIMTANRLKDRVPQSLVTEVEKRAKKWIDAQAIRAEYLPPIERLYSGVKASMLFPRTADLRFIVINTDLDNDVSAELMASFLSQPRGANDKLIRVMSNEQAVTSIYYIVTPDELVELKRTITDCNRQRVSSLLDRS